MRRAGDNLRVISALPSGLGEGVHIASALEGGHSLSGVRNDCSIKRIRRYCPDVSQVSTLTGIGRDAGRGKICLLGCRSARHG